MNFHFDLSAASGYKSNSQIIRKLTENWVAKNLYCPICGQSHINQYEANHPVGDFFCNSCSSDFELKSKDGIKLSSKILDGAYDTMIERITSFRNPNFFFMNYKNYTVQNFILIPNHFFTPPIIEKRKPLSPEARRAGWVGCNINISNIPNTGRIFIVKNQEEIDHEKVIAQYAKTKTLKTSNIEARGWLLDILMCIEKIPGKDFTLKQVYTFEDELRIKHPENNFIKDKIRQQLQYLRDKGFIEFISPGHYKKIN